MTSDEPFVAALRDFASTEALGVTNDLIYAEAEVVRLERELAEAKAVYVLRAATWRRFWDKWNGPTEQMPVGGIEQYQAEDR